MRGTLKKLASAGMKSYLEQPRSEWILQQPAQLALAVSQVAWCQNVSAALSGSATHDELRALRAEAICKLEELTALVGTDVSQLQRRSVTALITIGVHNRDVVSRLIAGQCESPTDFAWQMQLRCVLLTDQHGGGTRLLVLQGTTPSLKLHSLESRRVIWCRNNGTFAMQARLGCGRRQHHHRAGGRRVRVRLRVSWGAAAPRRDAHDRALLPHTHHSTPAAPWSGSAGPCRHRQDRDHQGASRVSDLCAPRGPLPASWCRASKVSRDLCAGPWQDGWHPDGGVQLRRENRQPLHGPLPGGPGAVRGVGVLR